ncbi:helix-turn-helix domain-containing protein [Pseudoalteromonas sp. SR45-1]|uniref:helix-turn-helix domain-containing protein n=1 Tax=Pseudoalteromonas sp. SR45-1 TaxID=2760932 RepID=UPI001C71DCD5|nr:helix-turn-helix transcriptional regulator [Pseudoalteromonas sp. SR45-1]
MVQTVNCELLEMAFPERLESLRKERGMTQQVLADAIQVHVSQIRRYESGNTQPTLDVLRKLAIALAVSADLLVFDKDERNPRDELKRQFEALNDFDDNEVHIARELLDSLILKHNAKQAFLRPLRT